MSDEHLLAGAGWGPARGQGRSSMDRSCGALGIGRRRKRIALPGNSHTVRFLLTAKSIITATIRFVSGLIICISAHSSTT